MRSPFLFACTLAAIACAALVRTDALANAPPGEYTISVGGSIYDNKTLLRWQAAAVPPRRTVDDATTYCSGLALDGLNSGWRLPSIRELLTIIDETQTVPPLWDQSAFGTTGPGQIWSGTPDASGSNGEVWAIDLTTGGSTSFIPTTLQGVLCVHP